ncbi:MAG: class I SAM-dependent methyltransferase [Gammaproteobacteria bacterium]|nr:class I SAM-dependent methyltransferase [Gammaproteobacteria bacterium]MDH5736026.1 class I SAM-dependent methyltransferase [Gammaproteobacteria bacterium]
MPDWDQHYLLREAGEQSPADVLIQNEHLLPVSGKVLDYACGLGANACWLAAKGYSVTAWDGSAIAIDKIKKYAASQALTIHAEVRDLENNPPTAAEFDLVIVSFFLHRPTLKKLQAILKPGGLLCYQTFSGEQSNGRGPSNPEFRLQQGELLKTFADMKILFYREDNGVGNLQQGLRDQVMFIAAKK